MTGGSPARAFSLVAALMIGVAPLSAQEPPVAPPADTVPVQPASACQFPAVPDTGRAPSLVEWPATDTLVRAMLARQGYVATRYCADTVMFDAANRILRLRGRAAIERDGTVLVGDSVVYDDSSRTLFAYAGPGRAVTLRDPAQGDDIVAEWIDYDLETRTGRVGNVRTAVTSGQRWILHADRMAIQVADSATGQPTSAFGFHGTITSCDLEEPHYHFAAREMKMVSRNIMVSRPAILYIRDIPVMWLPFVFQDLREGRRSGILSPRLGFSDIVRNSPSYRRQLENIGYYFAINDYMDGRVWLDWRSGARATSLDPGWIRWSGEWQYNWIDRFLGGRMGFEHHRLTDGRRSTGVSWQHRQQFSASSSMNANINYMTNTQVRRQTGFEAAEVLGTISSNVNYSNRIGPASISLGGSSQQQVGRDELSVGFPSFSISTGSLNLGEWLVWTPSFSTSNNLRLRLPPQGQYSYRYFLDAGGVLDSVPLRRDERTTNASFDTPLQIFGFKWRNSFTVTEQARNYPEPRLIQDVRDTSIRVTRIFDRTHRTSINWETGFELPGMSRGRWNIAPSVSLVNVDPSAGFWVRTERTGGEFVRQTKRLRYSLGISPTLFGLWPGFAGFERFRHALSPSLSWSYSPKGDVSDEFLAAINQTRPTYIGALPAHQLSLGLSQNIEGRLRAAETDTASQPTEGRKVTLLRITTSSLSYDFERAAELRRRSREAGRPAPGLLAGFATSTFRLGLTSEMVPGFDIGVDYSLFEGSLQSDTSRFKPYRTGISATMRFDEKTNPWILMSRIFGLAVPSQSVDPPASPAGEQTDSLLVREVGSMPIAGRSRQSELMVARPAGWSADFTFSAQRQRPPVGTGEVIIFDPFAHCEELRDNPPIYDLCVRNVHANPPLIDTLSQTTGGPLYQYPPTMTMQANLGLNVTPLWTMRWSTMYDFQGKSFASHSVSLQRDMHDWRAIFAFNQSPNGNFAFTFFIALKAEPDLKFDYRSRTYRAQ
ncbi:MAG TPA: putative LPS assembly protein LptD [Gemmatimonadaceae bacterium]|nr:putative LPS assembly protein LptD [Gemmatimonadaceae bacterium]